MQKQLPGGARACIALGLLSLMAIAFLVCGCTQPVQPATTPVATTVGQVQAPVTTPASTTTASTATAVAPEGKKMVTFTEKDNGTTVEIAAGSRFAIQLEENPTTGFMWNATTTAGLEILSSDFTENSHAAGMTGVGGIRTWVLTTPGPGEPVFTAVYKRSWEPVTGNETAYTLTVHAVRV